MGVTRAGGVDRDDPRGRDVGDLVAARQHAARRPGPDDDPGRAVPPAMIGSTRPSSSRSASPIAAWCGIMLADIALRSRNYTDKDLYDVRGRYGDVRWVSVALLVAGTIIGWAW